MRPIDLVLIHCAATPNGTPFTAADIDAWHRERGFQRTMEFRKRQNPALAAIGYHFVVYLNGACATGRHLDEVGAHAAGHNANSIGICLIGTDRFSRAQWEMLRANVWAMRARYPGARVLGHRDLPGVKKSCPGFDVAAWLAGDGVPLAGHILDPEPPRARNEAT